MASLVTIDLRHVGRGLDIPLRQIQSVVELLDEGNTVPFITRYRKDQTGGLDEEKIREIQDRLTKTRLLADRKQTILRSIESQGKLTEALGKQILAATTAKRLEDLYLPFKPKKQTLATLARNRGLEPLAREILEAAPSCADLDARAAEFVSVDRQVSTAADALLGAGHILAEQFSELAELRQRLREVLQRTGVLVSSQIPPGTPGLPAGGRETTSAAKAASSPRASAGAGGDFSAGIVSATTVVGQRASDAASAATIASGEHFPVDFFSATTFPGEHSSEEISAAAIAADARRAEEGSEATTVPIENSEGVFSVATAPGVHFPEKISAATVEGDENTSAIAAPASFALLDKLNSRSFSAAQRKLARQQAKEATNKKRELAKKKQEEKKIKDFRDYFEYREEIRKMPPHRVLAINRGERAKILRVRIETDLQAMVNVIEAALAPPNHPHADYLRGCARDALNRLILPSLEREVRRELTERAETHAVGVFAKNLRNLLLQPPVHNHRVLAVDPGFRSGCKLAALDQFGNLLGHDVIFLVGKPDRRDEARRKSLELIRQHQLTVVVIGNGTACRHAEDFFAELIDKELKEQGTAYVIVNEAGASVYSTSPLGREEFPQCDAVLRGAISIGRRLQDPLSELVKIDPANIGVGLYQHDVKAKHLRTSLDEVVASCVNYVGVEANTASPALLRYVSGLNQLTARRLYEYRREHGPFRNRRQLLEVPGFGEAAFVQAAGFLKISDGDNPLDATWIHPESYPAAEKALERLQGTPSDLQNKEAAAALAERIAGVDPNAMAQELEVGSLTLTDILSQLIRPGRDPREDLPAPVFNRGILKLEDLAPGMELTGTVLNVVDFGCFIDIGMHQSGLVHISRLADKYVRDPHDVVAVGDIVKVWVTEVDKERQRVSLTMVRPGSEQPKHPPRQDERRSGRPGGRRNGRPQGERPAATEQSPESKNPEEGGAERRERRGGGGPRPPRPSGQDRGRQSHDRGRPPREQHRPPPRPRPAPKPLIPITDAMKVGKEPMRTFGDLLQFYHQKPTDAESEAQPPVVESAAGVEPSPPAAATSPTVENSPVIESAPEAAVEMTAIAESPAASEETSKETSAITVETPPETM